MEFFKHDANVDFMGLRVWAAVLSVIILLLSFIALGQYGLNWGLEFTGGTQVHLSFPKPADLNQVRENLLDAGFRDVIVQTYGPTTDALVRLSGGEDSEAKSLANQLGKLLPDATVKSINYIGPQVGKELATNGALAMFVALLGTGIYIALRFEYRLAISAAVALIHDPVVILGVFAYTGMEFDLISLAALLTVIGYSLNDTIVVFDRVRENFRKHLRGNASEVVNLSVNQTLSRTIITSGLTLLAVIALFLFGGEVLHGFATALIIGIVVGTYSSIYISGALAVQLGLTRKDLLPVAIEADSRP